MKLGGLLEGLLGRLRKLPFFPKLSALLHLPPEEKEADDDWLPEAEPLEKRSRHPSLPSLKPLLASKPLIIGALSIVGIILVIITVAALVARPPRLPKESQVDFSDLALLRELSIPRYPLSYQRLKFFRDPEKPLRRDEILAWYYEIDAESLAVILKKAESAVEEFYAGVE